MVINAIKNNGNALAYASTRLRSDYNIVLLAVTTHGYALKYAGIELTNNKDIVLSAYNSYENSLIYTSSKIKEDNEFMLNIFAHKNIINVVSTTIESTKISVYNYTRDLINIRKNICVLLYALRNRTIKINQNNCALMKMYEYNIDFIQEIGYFLGIPKNYDWYITGYGNTDGKNWDIVKNAWINLKHII